MLHSRLFCSLAFLFATAPFSLQGANTVSYNTQLDYAESQPITLLSVPKFESSLGILNFVQVHFRADSYATFRYEQTDPSSSGGSLWESFMWLIGFSAYGEDPTNYDPATLFEDLQTGNVEVILRDENGAAFNESLNPYDGFTDFDGISGKSFGPFPVVSINNPYSFQSPDDFDYFTASYAGETADFVFLSAAQEDLSVSGGIVEAEVLRSQRMAISVTYSFTPNPVPEPGTLLPVVLGLAFFAGARRRVGKQG